MTQAYSVFKCGLQLQNSAEMSASCSLFATFFRVGTGIHGCGAIQLFLSETGLFDNSLFGLESWLEQSEFGGKEGNMGLVRNFFPDTARHGISKFRMG